MDINPRIYYVEHVVPPFRAMTIPPFGIFIKKAYEGDPYIEKHEKIHWAQYKRMGLIMFYIRYFFQLVFIGYDTMPMEMEARQGETEYNKWNHRKTYHK